MDEKVVCFRRLHADAKLPQYKTDGSAGFDFSAVVDLSNGKIVLKPGEQKVINTGWAVAVPEGYQLEVRPRSGLSFKHSITVTNSPGTVDSDYRDEVKVILFNLGKEDFVIENGDRIAQGIIMPAPKFELKEVADLTGPNRGGGFGSTGIKD